MRVRPFNRRERAMDSEVFEEIVEALSVGVVVLDDPECKRLMQTFIQRYPQVWAEDIGE